MEDINNVPSPELGVYNLNTFNPPSNLVDLSQQFVTAPEDLQSLFESMVSEATQQPLGDSMYFNPSSFL